MKIPLKAMVVTACLWLCATWGGCRLLGWPAQGLFLFWALSLADLWALSKFLEAVLGAAAGRKAIFRASFWGVVKLACLGSIVVTLWHSRAFSMAAEILGLSTIWIVPLVGGYFWSRKELEHA